MKIGLGLIRLVGRPPSTDVAKKAISSMVPTLAIGNSKMSQMWALEMSRRGQRVEIVPNRVPPDVVRESVRQFLRRYPAGVIVDAAYNPVQLGPSMMSWDNRTLADRLSLYAEAGVRHLAIVTRVNMHEFERLRDMCAGFRITAWHLSNMVVGVSVISKLISTIQWTRNHQVTIYNEFHRAKPDGASDGALQLESLIRQQRTDLLVMQTFGRRDVSYINLHQVTISSDTETLVVGAVIRSREVSLFAMTELVKAAGNYNPGLHAGFELIIPALEGGISIPKGSRLAAYVDGLNRWLKSLGYVPQVQTDGRCQTYCHPQWGEEFFIEYGVKNYSRKDHSAVAIVGGGALGAFSAHFLSQMGVRVQWVLGRTPPAASHSSLNKHLDIIFKRVTNGEMYRPVTLFRDWINPNSGVDMGRIDGAAILNAWRAFQLSELTTETERESQLHFSKTAMDFVDGFWRSKPGWSSAVLEMARPQLFTSENRDAIYSLERLLHRRGANVRLETDRELLSEMLGTPVGSCVVGALIHDRLTNGQIDFDAILRRIQTQVRDTGGEIIPENAIVQECPLSLNEVSLDTGRRLTPAAVVLAMGSDGNCVTPLTGVSATIYLPGILRLPTTINRFTFSSTWGDWIRVTSGVLINGKDGQLSPKLIRNMARDLETVPLISEASGISNLAYFSDEDFKRPVKHVSDLTYQMKRSPFCLTSVDISRLGKRVAHLEACPGRPYRGDRGEPVPLVHIDGNTVHTPACNMAGLNWGPLAGAATARAVQLILENKGINTNEIPGFQAVEAEFPFLKGARRWPFL